MTRINTDVHVTPVSIIRAVREIRGFETRNHEKAKARKRKRKEVSSIITHRKLDFGQTQSGDESHALHKCQLAMPFATHNGSCWPGLRRESRRSPKNLDHPLHFMPCALCKRKFRARN
jgi:hypothetical protein